MFICTLCAPAFRADLKASSLKHDLITLHKRKAAGLSDVTPSRGLSGFQELFRILSSCNLPGTQSSASLPLSTDLLQVAKDIRVAGAEGHT